MASLFAFLWKDVGRLWKDAFLPKKTELGGKAITILQDDLNSGYGLCLFFFMGENWMRCMLPLSLLSKARMSSKKKLFAGGIFSLPFHRDYLWDFFLHDVWGQGPYIDDLPKFFIGNACVFLCTRMWTGSQGCEKDLLHFAYEGPPFWKGIRWNSRWLWWWSAEKMYI